MTERHIHQVFISSLLEKPNHSEAVAWLQAERHHKATRRLGRFKRERDAAKFVQALYDKGAAEVIVPDIYANGAGSRYADCLLVGLPKTPAKRKAVRKAAKELEKRRLGAVQPDADIGETHLYLSMS